MKNIILHGHVIDKLKEIPDSTVQCVVTSPPYWGLRDYGTATWEGGDEKCDHKQKTARNDGGRVNTNNFHGSSKADSDKGSINYVGSCPKCGAKRIDQQIGIEKTPEEYVENLVKVFREVRRVLRNDGTLWLVLGDSYNGSGGGAGGDYNKGGLKEGQPKYKGRNVPTLKPKDLVGIPWMVAFALRADGWWLRSDIIWNKKNPMPESVTDRPTKSHEYIFLLTKSAKYYYDADAIKEPQVEYERQRRLREKDQGLDSVYKLVSEGKTGQVKQSDSGAIKNVKRRHELAEIGMTNKKSVWTINTKPYPGAHFAVFPDELIIPCVKAGTSERGNCTECGASWERIVERTNHVNKRETAHVPNNSPTKTDSTQWQRTTKTTNKWRPTCKCYGLPLIKDMPTMPAQKNEEPIEDYNKRLVEHGVAVSEWQKEWALLKPQYEKQKVVSAIVLDPFFGSGTTGEVAQRLMRNWIGIELNEEYIKLANKRFDQFELWQG